MTFISQSSSLKNKRNSFVSREFIINNEYLIQVSVLTHFIFYYHVFTIVHFTCDRSSFAFIWSKFINSAIDMLKCFPYCYRQTTIVPMSQCKI